ncbi:hypothetical protein EMEDMD4_650028 [Sinorhizobium medicae]|uniref:Uncharacterized protein n=1 Tax=Sinorhizobium medicae TaxID=110321 RepID=A0A508X9Q4_9HYPH|nr:hypothetical protein EMEDMD4_650028 [Sinorhizobium medicae]
MERFKPLVLWIFACVVLLTQRLR